MFLLDMCCALCMFCLLSQVSLHVMSTPPTLVLILVANTTQIDGVKEVTMFSPHHNERLYEGYIPEAVLDFSPTSGTVAELHFV